MGRCRDLGKAYDRYDESTHTFDYIDLYIFIFYGNLKSDLENLSKNSNKRATTTIITTKLIINASK